MMFFILSLIFIVIPIIALSYGVCFPKDNDEWLAYSSITCFVVGFILFICCAIDKETNPTAIDVYRGKTTLEVTYKDGVPIDTVVVFKEFKERK